jgi:hypothetical protein
MWRAVPAQQLHLAGPLTRQRQRANVHVDMKAIRSITAKKKSPFCFLT